MRDETVPTPMSPARSDDQPTPLPTTDRRRGLRVAAAALAGLAATPVLARADGGKGGNGKHHKGRNGNGRRRKRGGDGATGSLACGRAGATCRVGGDCCAGLACVTGACVTEPTAESLEPAKKAPGPTGPVGPTGARGQAGATGPAGAPTGPTGSLQFLRGLALAGNANLVWDAPGEDTRLLVSNLGGPSGATVLTVQATALQAAPLVLLSGSNGFEVARLDAPGPGFGNLAVGRKASFNGVGGDFNLAVGDAALGYGADGFNNVAVGESALFFGAGGNRNVAVGPSALRSGATGSNNLALGSSALGSSMMVGSRNIGIGAGANVPSATADNQLSIGNLIYGTGLGATGSTVSGGKIGIGVKAPAATLHVGSNNGAGSGDIRSAVLAGSGNRAVYSDANGTLTNSSSDASLKTEVEPISGGLAAVGALRPVRFRWRDAGRFGAQAEVGLLAQEVRQVVPEVVGVNSDGTLSVDYPKLVAPLIMAVQEQQAIIEAQQAAHDAQQARIDALLGTVGTLQSAHDDLAAEVERLLVPAGPNTV